MPLDHVVPGYSVTRFRRVVIGTMLFLGGLQFVSAATVYNFNSDTLGQNAANTTVTAGTFNVVNDPSLGYSLKATTQTGVIAGVLFNQFATSTDYSVTWKQSYDDNLGRGGFTLRAQSTDTNVANSAGAKLGYLFQVYSSNSVYIWKVGSSNYTSLWSGSLGKAKPRWFKATVQGTSLSFYYSNDGVEYTLLGSTTDATYTSGVVQYTAGYGAAVNNDVIDDITITPTIDITGSSSFTGTSGVAVPITNVQIAGATTTVPVKLFVSSGTLAMSTTTGITFNGPSSGSTVYFSGSPTDVNNALASLTYTKSGAGSDTLEVSLVNSGEVFFSGSGHLYEYISSTLTWGNAKTAAESLTKYGATGYLATITSQAENDFVSARLTNAGWMGASDSGSEGVWRWVVGPENNTQFWSGNIGGSTVGGNYANWNTNEPNDSGGNEDCGQFLSGASGKWNDLPCTGTTLPGYVVEYGADGALPTVTAKNISLTIEAAPALNSLSPLDNATNIPQTANLVITFNKTMATSTGTIVIRKVSDNSVVESIDVTSEKVTGGGTSVMTINPDTVLAENTAYYITIPSGAFRDLSNVVYAGISASTTWNFTTGDYTAPVITQVVATASTTVATTTWTTNENSTSRVAYGPSTAYGTTTATNLSSVLSHEVTLTGLVPCVTYHYAVVSTDDASNTATSTNKTFTTAGCAASSTPSNMAAGVVAANAGGTTTLSHDDATLAVSMPANFTSTSSSVVIQLQTLPASNVLQDIGVPQTVIQKVGAVVFDVKAIIDSTVVLDSFDAPVTITYTYTDSDIRGIEESSLLMYHYHDNAWSSLNDCSVNQSTNTITCTAPHFSIFAVFGSPNTSSKTFSASYFASAPTSFTQVVTEPVQVVATATPATKGASFQFTKNLRLGMDHEEVKKLQQFLNTKGFPVSSKGAGSIGNETTYFGIKTKNALIAFQEANASVVLTPQNLPKGTGHFLSYTKAFANSMLAVE